MHLSAVWIVLSFASSAYALPQPPHDDAAGITCADCHIPYGGISGYQEDNATDGSTTSLANSGVVWTDDQWTGGVVSFVSGANTGLFRDVIGNSAGGAGIATLHPDGLVSTNGFTLIGTADWAAALAANDDNGSYARKCCGGPGSNFVVDMDSLGPIDPAATINSVTLYAYATYVGCCAGVADIKLGYKTGAATIWDPVAAALTENTYTQISSITYTTDSDGGALDVSDIEALQVGVQRSAAGFPDHRITEVYAEVSYATEGTLEWGVPLPVAVAAGDTYRLGVSTQYDIEILCKGCHNPAGVGAPMAEVGLHDPVGDTVIGCGICHEPHNTDPNSGLGDALIREDVRWGTSSGVVSPNYLEGGPDYNGICETCHTQTGFHRNDASGDHTHFATEDCADCHGHGAGFVVDLTSGSHTMHLTDANGPTITCATGDLGCHGAQLPPLLDDGNELATTGVCDDCHSPDGSYDGVDDAAIGARTNWELGVYDNGSLVAGKEKWCAGCHDDGTSVIDTVPAPNVVGDETAPSRYGTGWGFYKTGHGVPVADGLPWTGGTVPGPGLSCEDCHVATSIHIDGVSQTYDDDAMIGSAADYQNGYRLVSVLGERPMNVPRNCTTPSYDDFRLCLQCHAEGPFVDETDMNTNFRNDASGPLNSHYYHLNICNPGTFWDSDGDGAMESRGSCVSCHNPHGNESLSMYWSDEIAYFDPGVTYVCGGPNPFGPTPGDVWVQNSTGTVYNAGVGANCWGCHGSCGFNALYMRVPF